MKLGLNWSPGCRLIHGELRFHNQFTGNCPWETTWGGIVDNLRPSRVLVLTGVWDMFDVRPVGQPTFVAPGSPGWDDAFGQRVENLIKVLSRHGSQVTIRPIIARQPGPRRRHDTLAHAIQRDRHDTGRPAPERNRIL